MRKYIIVMIMSMAVLVAYSQEDNSVDGKTTKKLTKQQKLEQKNAEEEATAKLVDLMVEQKKFVLEANYLSNQTGERVIVDNRLNFIVIDSSKIVIQLGSNTGLGANGVGGITADGTISRFDVRKIGKTQRSYSIHVYTMTHIGSYDIFFDISPSGNADASVSGTTRGKLNYHGKLVPLKQSRVYKGMAI
jgi:hypothetical protein